ncbi:MAG: DUF342 domain-containing protein [Bacillota bacterium]
MGQEVGGQRAENTVAINQGKVEISYLEEGRNPTITACPGVDIWVNGSLCRGTVALSGSDKVQLVTRDERRKGALEINISEDELEAELIAKPAEIIERQVPDHPPQADLQIHLMENHRYEPASSLQQALMEIRARGINYGIDQGAIEQALSSCQEHAIVIARGDPPIKATDPWVDLKIRQEQRIPLELGGQEKIDYHERYSFTAVEAGDLVAILYPGVAGKLGKSVKGKVLSPDLPQELYLTAGKGVDLSEDNLQAMATMVGRPMVTIQGQNVLIQILPSLDIDGDVNLQTGNVRFKGDLLITGNVREGMVAEAWGSLQVNRDVIQASINGMGQVIIKENVLSSTIVAGGGRTVFKDLLPILEDIEDQLGGLDLALEQMSKKPGFNIQAKLGPLLQLLLDNKFQELPTKADALLNILVHDKVAAEDGRLKELSLSIASTLGRRPLAIDLDTLKALHDKAKTLVQEYLAPFQQPGDLEAGYALNSNLKATGSVTIKGQGCFNTKITAGGNIKILKIFRGGEIFAVGDVYVGEAGSPGGTLTKIRIHQNAKVTLGKVWENTTVQVGHYQYNFNQVQEKVTVSLDDQGNLQVGKAGTL